MPPSPSAPPRRFDTLDGLRGVAAAVVMIMHASEAAGLNWFRLGGLAVDLFFILSGFVLAHAYGGREAMGLGRFMRKRVARLYPAYLFGLVLGGVVLLGAVAGARTTLSQSAALASLAANLLYLPFPNHAATVNLAAPPVLGALFPANPPYWSLFFELVANAMFFTLYRLSRRGLAMVAAASVLALVAYARWLEVSSGTPGLSIFVGWGVDNMAGGLPRVLYGFTCGILLHRLATTPAVMRWLKRAAHVPGGDLLMLTAVVLLLGADFSRLRGLYALAVICLLAPALVLLGTAIEPPHGWRLRLIRWLGWISYPLYCVHFPVMSLCGLIAGQLLAPVPLLATMCLMAILVAAIGAAWFDEPIRAHWAARTRLSPG